MTGRLDSAGIDRRHVLAGGLAAAGALGLGACGDGATGATEDPIYGGAQPGTSASTPTPSSTGTTPAPVASAPLVALADVPVGGAVGAKDAAGKPIIVAQPTAGSIVAFSAICTHQGCTVAPAGERLTCPCHGSVFAVTDGSNVSGPAPRPLAKVEVTVADGQVLPA